MHKFLRWKSIFYRLAATLNIFFKWLSIFDLDQTFFIKISHPNYQNFTPQDGSSFSVPEILRLFC